MGSNKKLRKERNIIFFAFNVFYLELRVNQIIELQMKNYIEQFIFTKIEFLKKKRKIQKTYCKNTITKHRVKNNYLFF